MTCGAQFAPASRPPASCPICADERQFVGQDGQQWTALATVRQTYTARVEQLEPGLLGIGIEPAFAIGQRALLLSGVLWDCVALVDDEIERAVLAAGGLDRIAISHPHFYTGMVEWAERFDAKIVLHEADRSFVMRPSPRIELWQGERHRLSAECELIRIGGHFPGATILHWAAGADGRGTVLSGDAIQVVADRDWVSFMWSYPNLIPLPPDEIARISAIASTLDFERLYGSFWERFITSEARAKVLRSANRYIDAVTGIRSAEPKPTAT